MVYAAANSTLLPLYVKGPETGWVGFFGPFVFVFPIGFCLLRNQKGGLEMSFREQRPSAPYGYMPVHDIGRQWNESGAAGVLHRPTHGLLRVT